MKTLFIILITHLPLLGFAQNSLSFLRSNAKIDKILLLPPVTMIYKINNGSHQQIDPALSQETYRLTSAELQKSFPNSINLSLFHADSVIQTKLGEFIVRVSKSMARERQLKRYELPDSILLLFDTTKANYVFCTYSVGFKRTRNNLVRTDQALDILQLFTGGVGARPLESATLMNCFIMDLKKKNILYFEKNIWNDMDPTEMKTIKLQLTRIIAHCF